MADIDIRALRRTFGMSQPQFAAAFGFTVASLRDWEQGRRRPEMAARTLLMVIRRNPDIVQEAVRFGLAITSPP